MVANSSVFLYACLGWNMQGTLVLILFFYLVKLDEQIKVVDIGFMNEIYLHFNWTNSHHKQVPQAHGYHIGSHPLFTL